MNEAPSMIRNAFFWTIPGGPSARECETEPFLVLCLKVVEWEKKREYAMTQVMQSVIDRLRALPEADQERVAPHILDYLKKLDILRAAVQEGLDDIKRGDVVPFEAEDIIRRGEARLAARNSAE